MKISVKSYFLQLERQDAPMLTRETFFFIIFICFLTTLILRTCLIAQLYATGRVFHHPSRKKHSDICRPLFISFTSSCGSLCVFLSSSLHQYARSPQVIRSACPPTTICGSLFFGFPRRRRQREKRLLFNQGGAAGHRHRNGTCVAIMNSVLALKKKQKVTIGDSEMSFARLA